MAGASLLCEALLGLGREVILSTSIKRGRFLPSCQLPVENAVGPADFATFRASDSAQKFVVSLSVSLSEEEVRSSLSAENIDETVIQKVVADLQ